MRNDIEIPCLLPPCLGRCVYSCLCEPVCVRGEGRDKGLTPCNHCLDVWSRRPAGEPAQIMVCMQHWCVCVCVRTVHGDQKIHHKPNLYQGTVERSRQQRKTSSYIIYHVLYLVLLKYFPKNQQLKLLAWYLWFSFFLFSYKFVTFNNVEFKSPSDEWHFSGRGCYEKL